MQSYEVSISLRFTAHVDEAETDSDAFDEALGALTANISDALGNRFTMLYIDGSVTLIDED